MHTILTGPVISAAMGLPANLASTLLQQHVNSTLQGQATLAPLQVSQPLQVVTQTTNNVSQRPVQNQVLNRNNNLKLTKYYPLGAKLLFCYYKFIKHLHEEHNVHNKPRKCYLSFMTFHISKVVE